MVSIRFEVRGGFRRNNGTIGGVSIGFQSALRFAVVSDLWQFTDPGKLFTFQSALRFAVVSDMYALNKFISSMQEGFQSALRFAVVSDLAVFAGDHVETFSTFQSALRFAVVSDSTPWHAVLTSPVAAVLHTTPPHPLQPADRTCPKWGKTPSQVAYTPEAVFGRSPTPLSEGVSKTPAGSRDRRLPPTLPSCHLPARSARHRRIRQDSSHHRVVQHPGRWMGLTQGPGLLPAGRALSHDPQ